MVLNAFVACFVCSHVRPTRLHPAPPHPAPPPPNGEAAGHYVLSSCTPLPLLHVTNILGVSRGLGTQPHSDVPPADQTQLLRKNKQELECAIANTHSPQYFSNTATNEPPSVPVILPKPYSPSTATHQTYITPAQVTTTVVSHILQSVPQDVPVSSLYVQSGGAQPPIGTGNKRHCL